MIAYFCYNEDMKLINKKIIIAFDGPDNVGKGTQIQLLRKWLKHIPFMLTDLNRPIGNSDNEKINYGLHASENHLAAKLAIWKQGIPQIADRMHYTEYAYSILRGGHNIQTILNIEEKYKEMKDGFFTIIFVDKVENISARDDGKSNFDADNHSEIQSIYDRFIEIADYSIFDNVIINIQGKDIPTVQKEVQEILLKKFPDLLKQK